jgi:5-amino-6-(5-phospho-D-ribitylamino)uracil phosphatase
MVWSQKGKKKVAMPIEMIASDLDRTLLRTDNTISNYTADILRNCRQKGIKIVFATARPKRAVHRLLNILNQVQVDAIAFHNGAIVTAGETVLFSCGIAPQIVRNLACQLSTMCTTVSVEINDALYANFDASSCWPGVETNFSDFLNLPNYPAEKIIVGVLSMGDIERIASDLPDDLYIEMNDRKLGLIMNRAATKWNAIQALSAHFNVPTANIAAFGDDYNDVEMLKNCGTGVAVTNALDEAKMAADYVCESNDNDGVAKWLEKNVL